MRFYENFKNLKKIIKGTNVTKIWKKPIFYVYFQLRSFELNNSSSFAEITHATHE